MTSDTPGALTYLSTEGWCALLIIAFGCTDTHRAPTTPRVSTNETWPAAIPTVPTSPLADEPGAIPRTQRFLAAPKGSLDAFLAALSRASARAEDGRVLIAQFGDSHTAGDAFTGRMRATLQAEFGNAGRGYLLPGKPMSHYYQQDASYGTSGSWRTIQGWRSEPGGPIGLGMIRVTSTRAGATLWVGACEQCRTPSPVSQFEVYFAKADAAGRLEYQIDNGRWQLIDTHRTALDRSTVGSQLIPVPPGKHRLHLRARDARPVHLFGIALEHEQPGVVIDSLGIVGRQLRHLLAQDWTVVGEQLALRQPSLIVLQYGTNEADDSDLSVTQLEQRYLDMFAKLRAAVPTASILVLGPPDMGVAQLKSQQCQRLRALQQRRARTAAAAEAPIAGCTYHTPALLPEIVAAQRRAAAKSGVAFFDSFGAMGGANMMEAYYRQSPALAYSDRVHFTQPGYELWADLFLHELLGAYRTSVQSAVAAPAR